MDTFQVLADPNRRLIIELLAKNGRLSATEISDQFKITPAAISQHLKVLRESRLLNMEKKAQQRIYQINPKALNELEEWIKKTKLMWEERFSRLDKVLVQLKGGEK